MYGIAAQAIPPESCWRSPAPVHGDGFTKDCEKSDYQSLGVPQFLPCSTRRESTTARVSPATSWSTGVTDPIAISEVEDGVIEGYSATLKSEPAL